LIDFYIASIYLYINRAQDARTSWEL